MPAQQPKTRRAYALHGRYALLGSIYYDPVPIKIAPIAKAHRKGQIASKYVPYPYQNCPYMQEHIKHIRLPQNLYHSPIRTAPTAISTYSRFYCLKTCTFPNQNCPNCQGTLNKLDCLKTYTLSKVMY